MMRVVAAATLLLLLAACGEEPVDEEARFCDLDAQIVALSQNTQLSTPEEVEANFTRVRALLEEAVSIAPAAVAVDYAWYVNWQIEFFDLVADAGYDRSQVDEAAVDELFNDENRERFNRALTNLGDWVNSHCRPGAQP
jgi:hypothetical protein